MSSCDQTRPDNEKPPAEPGSIDCEYVLPYNTAAMTRLSLGTAILVSTVLLIPDTIAILPSTHNVPALLIRAAGLWLTVFTQWSLAFLGILQLASIINRGIVVDPGGIRLSRLSPRIDWSNVNGLAGEPRPLISRLIFLKEPAVRVQLYVRNKKGKIKTRPIDSLFFSQNEFQSLLRLICKSSFGFAPNAAQVVISNCDTRTQIQSAYQRAGTKSKLITAYIAIMLIAFTGRGAARNYFYNQAGQAVNRTDYEQGKRYCELSLIFDGTYPYALDRLGRCEFRLDEVEKAEGHWRQALKMKPDLVSAKVGLSNVLMKRGKFEEARRVLDNAARLEPRDIPVQLNLGHLNIRTGHSIEGIRNFDRALQLAPGNATVKLLSAEAYLSVGKRDTAQALLKGIKPEEVENHNRKVYEKLRKDLIAHGVGHE